MFIGSFQFLHITIIINVQYKLVSAESDIWKARIILVQDQCTQKHISPANLIYCFKKNWKI